VEIKTEKAYMTNIDALRSVFGDISICETFNQNSDIEQLLHNAKHKLALIIFSLEHDQPAGEIILMDESRGCHDRT
jgi:hypothetical protein